MSQVLFLLGPTACGKTDVACELYDRGGIEIVSVDSVMVYQGAVIGAAKPNSDTLAKYPHHLCDIASPKHIYSVGEFVRDSHDVVQAILARGNRALLVGGSMLYFRLLTRGLTNLPPANDEIRRTLQDRENQDIGVLYHDLQKIDEQAAQRIHPNNTLRIIRALEIYHLTGKNMSQLLQEQQKSFQQVFSPTIYSMMPDRDWLHQRINTRFKAIVDTGLVAETKQLFSIAPQDSPLRRAAGYKQAGEYLARKIDTQQLIEQGSAATRQLAKRQYTWLKSWTNIKGIISPEKMSVSQIANTLLN